MMANWNVNKENSKGARRGGKKRGDEGRKGEMVKEEQRVRRERGRMWRGRSAWRCLSVCHSQRMSLFLFVRVAEFLMEIL
jgi:hypothetical protein